IRARAVGRVRAHEATTLGDALEHEAERREQSDEAQRGERSALPGHVGSPAPTPRRRSAMRRQSSYSTGLTASCPYQERSKTRVNAWNNVRASPRGIARRYCPLVRDGSR